MGERLFRRSPARFEFLVIGDDTGKMDDGRMENEFTGIVGSVGQRTACSICMGIPQDRHELQLPTSAKSHPMLGLLTSAGLRVFPLRWGRLSPLRQGLVQHEVADVSEQAFDKKE